MRETTKAFFRHLLSVVLGIIITFSVQGVIDRAHVRREVRSALELVRAELVANIDDIKTMSDHMRQERKSAEYFLNNRLTLSKCPADSVNYHTGQIFAEIIRAYDSCENAVSNLKNHIATRDEMIDRSINESNVRRIAAKGNIDIKEYIKTGYGQYVIQWMSSQVGPEYYADVSDLEAAISAIDGFLGSKRRRK